MTFLVNYNGQHSFFKEMRMSIHSYLIEGEEN